ncbi:hypothetical protein R3Q06_10495 [Rhodococcus erythropolis]|uniref:hypothetical protein n=1 Tax=Rhodococcus erythropolis TaxID=1833 RepID=UPI002949F6AF|nr:hypothetical protein [Rhodococcus erythropolis]MDV6273927.1 hypothetical protein [Rhodococcus erythropolis]
MGVETFTADPAELASAAAGLTAPAADVTGFSASEVSTAASAGAAGSAFAAAIADNVLTVDGLGRAIGAGITATRTNLENSAREFARVDIVNGARIEDSGAVR